MSIPPRFSVLALMAVTLCGCAGGVRDTGVRVGDETLKQFKAGSTTEGWVRAILGAPTSEAAVAGVENTRVLRYASGQEASGFLAALTGASTRNTAVTYFVVTDGVVTRYWADRSKEHTLLGGAVEDDPGAKTPN